MYFIVSSTTHNNKRIPGHSERSGGVESSSVLGTGDRVIVCQHNPYLEGIQDRHTFQFSSIHIGV